MENPGIDPGTSHMLSERSTTWANSPVQLCESITVRTDKSYRRSPGNSVSYN